MRRFYVGGDGGNFGWVDPYTLAYTALSSIPSGKRIVSIQAVADDDIWVGLMGPYNGKPWVAHWNGLSWTETEFTWMPLSGVASRYLVNSMLAFATDEVYAAGGGGHFSNGRIWKYDGSWAHLASMNNYSEGARAMWGTSGSDLYVAVQSFGPSGVYYWNGLSIASASPDGNNDGCGGCKKSNGDNFWYGYQGGKLKQQGAIFTDPWTLIKDLWAGPGVGPGLWLNPVTETIWLIEWRTDNTDWIYWWDGIVWQEENLTGVAFSDFNRASIDGFHVTDGPIIAIGSAGGISQRGVTVRDTGGTWTKKALAFDVYAMHAYFIDDIPPVLLNQDPAPGEKNVSKTADIEFDITDVDLGVDVNTVKIYVNGLIVWSNDGAASGWSGFKSAITNGYHYTLVPPVEYRTSTVVVRAYAEDIPGNVLDETYQFYPSIDVDLTVIILAEKLIRVNFSQNIAANSAALDKNNYTIVIDGTTTEEVTVEQVLYDLDSSVLDYVDLVTTKPTEDTTYKVNASNIQLSATGSTIGSAAEGLYIAQQTKVDGIIRHISNMYDSSIGSNLFSIFAAIGNSDEEIGGKRTILVPIRAIEIESEIGEGSTYGTATYGTDTYGG